MNRCLNALLVVVLLVGTASLTVPSATAQAQQRGSVEERTGTAVLVDVSGSMRYDAPNWRSGVYQTLQQLIAGGNLNENKWRVDGEANDDFAQSIRAGEPLHIPGQPLLMAYVGEIQRQAPFVEYELVRPSTANDAADFIREKFPKTFNDAWTYKEVALAVARDAMLEQGAMQWYVVLVSDEDDDFEDSGKVPEQAKKLDNQYGTKIRQEKLLALSYREDTDLRMSVTRVTSRQDPCDENADLPLCQGPNPQGQDAEVVLRLPESDAEVNDTRPQFRWSASGNLSRFELVMEREEGPVQRKRVSSTAYRPDEELDGGSYTWQVIGKGNGVRVASAKRSFTVAGSSSAGAILGTLLALAGLGTAAYFGKRYYDKRREARQEIDL